MEEFQERIQEFIFENFDFLPAEVMVMIISIIPVMEMKAGIPSGALLGISVWGAVIFGILGNLLPILPILLLFRPVSRWLKRFDTFDKGYSWLHEKMREKGKRVQKYGGLGLMIFTAVPIPTTGVYSASLISLVFFIPIRTAALSIGIGVVIAAAIVGIISYPLFTVDE